MQLQSELLLLPPTQKSVTVALFVAWFTVVCKCRHCTDGIIMQLTAVTGGP
jgi:hypothetical protein